MSSSGPDLELKRAFQEVQQKMAISQQHIKHAEQQIEAFGRTARYADVVDAELNEIYENRTKAGITGEVETYEGVGRAFVKLPFLTIKERLADRKKTANEKITELSNNRKKMEQSMKDGENNLRELIAIKQMEMNKE